MEESSSSQSSDSASILQDKERIFNKYVWRRILLLESRLDWHGQTLQEAVSEAVSETRLNNTENRLNEKLDRTAAKLDKTVSRVDVHTGQLNATMSIQRQMVVTASRRHQINRRFFESAEHLFGVLAEALRSMERVHSLNHSTEEPQAAETIQNYPKLADYPYDQLGPIFKSVSTALDKTLKNMKHLDSMLDQTEGQLWD